MYCIFKIIKDYTNCHSTGDIVKLPLITRTNNELMIHSKDWLAPDFNKIAPQSLKQLLSQLILTIL